MHLKENAERTLASPRFQDDPFYRYILGLSCAHLSDWSTANMLFERNRRLLANDVLHPFRDYLLNSGGTLWRVQGRIQTGATKSFFQVDDLHFQFRMRVKDRWPTSSSVFHAYIVFSLAGPMATTGDAVCADVS